MTNIELVIKIPKEEYDLIVNDEACSLNVLTRAIANGIPLPEHGNLKNELDLDLFAPSLGTEEYVRDLIAKHNIDYVNGDDEDKIKDFAMDLIKSCMNVIKAAPIILKNEG